MEKETRRGISRRKFVFGGLATVVTTLAQSRLPEVTGFPFLTNAGNISKAWDLVHQKNKDIKGPFDAIVILGAGNQTRKGRIEPNVHGKMRLIAGADARRRNLSQNIVIAEGEIMNEKPTAKDYLERKYQKEEGKFSKIPKDSLYVENDSLNTATNMKVLDQTMKKNGWKKVLLITNKYHLLRATILALNFGIDATPVSAEDLLVQRDSRFKRVIDNFYKKPYMQSIEKGELGKVAWLIGDPKYNVPTSILELKSTK